LRTRRSLFASIPSFDAICAWRCSGEWREGFARVSKAIAVFTPA